MILPQALRPGDEVRVVSPASPLTPEKVQRGVELLESEGYRVTYGNHVFAADGYLAGNDQERAADLMEAFTDPNVKGIICSRGGYGCARLFPYLDLDVMAASGKMFGGFSDLTTLHLPLNRRGLVTLHCPMLITLSVEREPWVEESFRAILKGENPIPETAFKGETFVGGSADGVLTGGCMCLLGDSLATPDPLDAAGKLLSNEDVDENPHRVDAMFTQMLNAGVLQSAAGIIIGEMTGTDDRLDEKIGAWPWRKIVEDRLASITVPTIINFPFGHMKNMLSLPLGVKARLDADQGTLEILDPICAASQ
jgi:muramoyltetrapeptide carboxypeptidase